MMELEQNVTTEVSEEVVEKKGFKVKFSEFKENHPRLVKAGKVVALVGTGLAVAYGAKKFFGKKTPDIIDEVTDDVVDEVIE